MIQNRVLYALSRAVEEEGKDSTAYQEMRRADPLLRPFIRRKVQRSIRDALFATTVPSSHQEGAVHLMRLAYLHAASDLGDALPDDVEAVQRQYNRVQKPSRPSGLWLWSLLALGLLVGTSVFGVLSSGRSVASKRADASMRPAPPPSGAFAQGGKPSSQSTALQEMLTNSLPSYLLALDRVQRAKKGQTQNPTQHWEEEAKKQKDLILSTGLSAALGKDAFAQLTRVLQSIDAIQTAGPDTIKTITEQFLEEVGAFNDSLAALGLGYYIDGDVISTAGGVRFAIVYSFLVENVDLFSVNGSTIRALTLRRLDRLNIVQTLLGFTRPQLREAILLQDQVDELLVTYILPSLAPSASASLVDEETEIIAPEWQAPAEKRAGEVIRAEYGKLLAGQGVATLGEKLHRRHQLFQSWKKLLADQGMELLTPTTLAGDNYREFLEGMVPAAELEELEALQEWLRSEDAALALSSARRLLVASVARHEVQHRVDFSRENPSKLPEALIPYVGMEVSNEGLENRFASQAKEELSAYLGELARDQETTQVNLTLLSRFLFNRELWGGAECYVALVVFQEVARELGIEPPALVVQGRIERDRASALYLQLTEKPARDLQAAAKRAWERLFGETLPELKRASPYTK